MKYFIILISVLFLSATVAPSYADDFSQRVISKGTVTIPPLGNYTEKLELYRDWNLSYNSLKVKATFPTVPKRSFMYLLTEFDDAVLKNIDGGISFFAPNGSKVYESGGVCNTSPSERTKCEKSAYIFSFIYERLYPYNDDLYVVNIAFINYGSDELTFSYILSPAYLATLIPYTTVQSSPFPWLSVVVLPILVIRKKLGQRK